MGIWNTREKSLLWLSSELAQQSNLINTGFELHDKCIAAIGEMSKSEGGSLAGRFARVCGLTTTKARNLILGNYSLLLDALGQESGALLRPLIEAYELLIYFRTDPTRVDESIEGTLPKAGYIAEKISGCFKSLRQYLNDHASHFGLTFESVKGLIDIETASFRTVQTQSVGILKRNMSTINAFQIFFIRETIACLPSSAQTSQLQQIVEHWSKECISAFKLPDMPKA